MTVHKRPARNAAGRQGLSWDLVVDLPRKRGEKRIQRWIPFAGTERQAERERVRLEVAAEKGKLAHAGTLTLSEYLDQWMRDWVAQQVAPQTQESYKSVCGHWSRAIGQVKLEKLTPTTIQKVVTGWAESGLSPATIRERLKVLRGALRQAIRWKLITENPAVDVDAPRQAPAPERALTREQALAVLGAAREDPLGLAVVLALGLCLRAGEVFGLRWEDVDLKSGMVTVRRSLQALAVGTKEPKSGKVRRVAIPDFVRLALEEQQARQEAERAGLSGWNPLGVVLPDAAGNHHYHRTTDIMRRVCTAAGIERSVRLHDLRHTLATILLDGGESVRNVSELLGHSNPSVTLNVYAHVIASGQQRMAESTDKMFGK